MTNKIKMGTQTQIAGGDNGNVLNPWKKNAELDDWMARQSSARSDELRRRHDNFEKALRKTAKPDRMCFNCKVTLTKDSAGAECIPDHRGQLLWCKVHAAMRRRELRMSP